MVILKAANMFAGTTSQKGSSLKGFKCTAYRFSAKLKLKVMGVSCGEYCAALPGIDKVVSVACLRYFGRVRQIYEN